MSLPRAPRSAARRSLDWVFRIRADGRIVVGQAPNVALFAFTGALVLTNVLPKPAAGVFGIVAFGSLAWWAYDELFFGVNPFRRVLGAGILVGILARSVNEIR